MGETPHNHRCVRPTGQKPQAALSKDGYGWSNIKSYTSLNIKRACPVLFWVPFSIMGCVNTTTQCQKVGHTQHGLQRSNCGPLCGGNEGPKRCRLHSSCFNNTKFFPYVIRWERILTGKQTHSESALLYH